MLLTNGKREETLQQTKNNATKQFNTARTQTSERNSESRDIFGCVFVVCAFLLWRRIINWITCRAPNALLCCLLISINYYYALDISALRVQLRVIYNAVLSELKPPRRFWFLTNCFSEYELWSLCFKLQKTTKLSAGISLTQHRYS